MNTGNFTTGRQMQTDTFCVGGGKEHGSFCRFLPRDIWGRMEKRMRVKKTRGEETDALLVLWFMLAS
jgi:hypothetical protein